MKIKTADMVQTILWGLIAVSWLIGYIFENGIALIVCVGSLMIIIIIRILFWRCPYCEKYIGRDLGKYCRNCGKELK